VQICRDFFVEKIFHHDVEVIAGTVALLIFTKFLCRFVQRRIFA